MRTSSLQFPMRLLVPKASLGESDAMAGKVRALVAVVDYEHIARLRERAPEPDGGAHRLLAAGARGPAPRESTAPRGCRADCMGNDRHGASIPTAAQCERAAASAG